MTRIRPKSERSPRLHVISARQAKTEARISKSVHCLLRGFGWRRFNRRGAKNAEKRSFHSRPTQFSLFSQRPSAFPASARLFCVLPIGNRRYSPDSESGEICATCGADFRGADLTAEARRTQRSDFFIVAPLKLTLLPSVH